MLLCYSRNFIWSSFILKLFLVITIRKLYHIYTTKQLTTFSWKFYFYNSTSASSTWRAVLNRSLYITMLERLSSLVLFFFFFSYLLSLFQILVRAVPIKQGHKLRIIWPITPSIHHYKEAPCRYLGHLIGHEGEGSLFYVLKTLGRLCTSFMLQKVNLLADFFCTFFKLCWLCMWP